MRFRAGDYIRNTDRGVTYYGRVDSVSSGWVTYNVYALKQKDVVSVLERHYLHCLIESMMVDASVISDDELALVMLEAR